jgi:hypothetical protein
MAVNAPNPRGLNPAIVEPIISLLMTPTTRLAKPTKITAIAIFLRFSVFIIIPPFLLYHDKPFDIINCP